MFSIQSRSELMVQLYVSWIPAGFHVCEQGWIHREGGKVSLTWKLNTNPHRSQFLIFFSIQLPRLSRSMHVQMSSPVSQGKGWTWQKLADWAETLLKLSWARPNGCCNAGTRSERWQLLTADSLTRWVILLNCALSLSLEICIKILLVLAQYKWKCLANWLCP